MVNSVEDIQTETWTNIPVVVTHWLGENLFKLRSEQNITVVVTRWFGENILASII
jgi:hypothetical protein